MRTGHVALIRLWGSLLALCLGLPLYAAPTIGTTSLSPTSIARGAPTTVTVTSLIADPSVVTDSVNLQRQDSAGRVTAVLGTLRDDGQNGDAVAGDGTYTLRLSFTEFAPGPITMRVSASFKGALNRVFSGVMTLSVVGTAPARITLLAPANLSYTNISPTTVTGTVSDPSAQVKVNELTAPVTASGTFSVALPLREGPNVITATATSAAGAGTASIDVTLDTTPPHVTITTPQNQFVTSDSAISVAGIVNDIVVGTVNSVQATVTVNGKPAQVANRTFLATDIPLALGSNVIQVVARDRSANAATTQITVMRQSTAQVQLRLVSTNNQSGVIGALLPAPLIVSLVNGTGAPAANVPVIFKVTQNNGLISAGGAPAPMVITNTNTQGRAQVQWTLGQRVGAGGNTVEAYAVGYTGTAVFSATGTQGQPGKIVIDTGNSQIGVVNEPLPKPFIAVVVDGGNNRMANVPVTFTVKSGGGSFAGPQGLTVTTDSDGRAAASLTLGFQEGNGNNLVEANFPLNQGFPAAFTASGRGPGNPANTTISGVVLDNSNVPIPGVTIRAVLSNVLTSNSSIIPMVAAVQTNAQGQFSIAPAPVGFVKLLVDGSTAQRPGAYPTLDYDMVTIAGQNNTLGLPIFLLPLSTVNQRCVTATTGGGTLSIPEAPGFSLTFSPGQVTFPGGSKSGCVSVTVVHADKVPMVPGFGQQPKFIVTIQPAGAMFNPPAAITLPNVDGLKPRAVTEMYSFDHDIGSFVAIGTGTVSDDGVVIRSSPGVGVLKAGWHCGGDPNAIGTVADCPPCKYCKGIGGQFVDCVGDPQQIGQACGASNPFNNCFEPGTGTCGSTLSQGQMLPTGICEGGTQLPDFATCNSAGTAAAVCYKGKCTGYGTQCPVSCADNDPSTVDYCVNGSCIHGDDLDYFFCAGKPNNTPCGACRAGATCQNGSCLGGTPSSGSCGPCMTSGFCSGIGQCLGAQPKSDGTPCGTSGTCERGFCRPSLTVSIGLVGPVGVGDTFSATAVGAPSSGTEYSWQVVPDQGVPNDFLTLQPLPVGACSSSTTCTITVKANKLGIGRIRVTLRRIATGETVSGDRSVIVTYRGIIVLFKGGFNGTGEDGFNGLDSLIETGVGPLVSVKVIPPGGLVNSVLSPNEAFRQQEDTARTSVTQGLAAHPESKVVLFGFSFGGDTASLTTIVSDLVVTLDPISRNLAQALEYDQSGEVFPTIASSHHLNYRQTIGGCLGLQGLGLQGYAVSGSRVSNLVVNQLNKGHCDLDDDPRMQRAIVEVIKSLLSTGQTQDVVPQ